MAVKRRSEATKSERQVLREPTRTVPAEVEPITAPSSVVIGWLQAGSTPAALLVDFPGNARGPLRARTTVPLDRAALDRAVVTRQGAVLVFENGDAGRPIVTGLIWTGQPPTPFQDLLVSPKAAGEARPHQASIEARLDGERVVLEGRRSVELRCGDASITLRSDGKLVLRGAYIETYSKGLNRIKGASVKIN